jgi:hypothetical protein
VTGNEFVGLLRISLTRFRDEAEEYVRIHGFDPASGSAAATDRTTYPRPDSPLTVAAIASVLIESVGEHVTAFTKTITEPVEPIACWTCVRSMLESAAIAAWLFEPGIDIQTRVGRSFAHRYEGLEQQLKLVRAIGRSVAEVQQVEGHISDVEAVALRLGFRPVTNRSGERVGIGQRMPSATEMIKMMLDEDLAYRLLSAVAHGHFWAIQQLGFKEVLEPQPPTASALAKSFEKHSGTVQGYTFLAMRALKSLALPLWNQCLYYGWDKERLAAVLESVYDQLHATQEVRFWRPEPGRRS